MLGVHLPRKRSDTPIALPELLIEPDGKRCRGDCARHVRALSAHVRSCVKSTRTFHSAARRRKLAHVTQEETPANRLQAVLSDEFGDNIRKLARRAVEENGGTLEGWRRAVYRCLEGARLREETARGLARAIGRSDDYLVTRPEVQRRARTQVADLERRLSTLEDSDRRQDERLERLLALLERPHAQEPGAQEP